MIEHLILLTGATTIVFGFYLVVSQALGGSEKINALYLFITQAVCALLMGSLIHIQRERRRSREVYRATLEELRMLNRALQARTECAKAMIRATEEREFLEQVCRILVEHGGYRMAWVGYPQKDTAKTVCPVAQAGFDEGYLTSIHITWDDNDLGRGPTGTSIRAKRPALARNIATDPAMAPWRAAAIQHGYSSSAAFPMWSNDDILGTLTVYATMPEAFDGREVALLTELSNDLAFGVTTLRSRIARSQAELELLMLNQQLEQRVTERTREVLDLYNNAPCGYHSLGPDGMVIEMNDTELRWLGYQREEVVGRLRLPDLLSAQNAERFDQMFSLFVQSGDTRSAEWELRRKDGSPVTVLVTSSALRDAEGRFLRTRSTMIDISERKRLEAIVQENEEKFRVLFESTRDAVITTDVNGHSLDCNQAAVTMFGFQDKECLLKQNPGALSPIQQPDGRDSREGFVEVVRQVMAQGSYFSEWQHQRADGTEFPAEISISLAKMRDRTLLHGVVRDISKRKEAENQLRASETKFRQLIEMAPIPIGLANEKGEITYLNKRHFQTIGYSIEDVPTMDDWWQRAYPDEAYRSRIRQQWDAAADMAAREHADVEPQEYRVTCKNGTVRDVAISGLMLGTDFLATFLDITKLKQAGEKLRKLSQAVEYCPSMILITDYLGRVEYANPAWEQITGYRLDEVVGQRPSAVRSGVHPREYYAHLWAEITSGRIWRGEFCNRKKNGDLYWESCAIAPVHDDAGTITHFVAVKEDITDQKQAAEDLRQAKEAADSSNRAKSTFLANMSHEIRTPMNAILGFSQLLQRDQGLSDQQQQQVTTITRSGEHLMEIINDILEMSRIESGRVTLNPSTFDLHQLLDDLERMFALRTQAKNLRFHVERSDDVPRYVMGDEIKLRQVIINLLGNAVKFTPGGGLIVLRVRAIADLDGMLRLHAEVEDSGPGISPEDLPYLFEAFFQTSSGKLVPGGTGLGLPISRKFVNLMGGDLTVNSQLGAGSIFRFDVQLGLGVDMAKRAEIAPPRQVLHLQPEAPAYRILVADDRAINRELLEQLLRPIGFEIRTANDGVETVALCKEWLPHLVLLDLRMPVMDGYEAAHRIREAHGASIKIIALSASVFTQDRQRALDQGADVFMAKPFLEADLLEQIKQLTGVEYLYNDPKSPSALVSSEAEDGSSFGENIRRLPTELVDALRDATCRAKFNQMLALTDQVATVDEPLGRRLRQLVEGFEFGALQTLLDQNKPNK